MAILAIDQGTSGTKVLLLENGEVVARGSVDVEVEHYNDGRVECDPTKVWDSILQAISQVFSYPTSKKVRIDAVSLANQGESVLAWDERTLEPQSKVMIWQDSRSAHLCQERQEFNNRIREITGLENDPYFVAPKIRWLKNQNKNYRAVSTLDSWLISKLTGEFVTDISTASRSMLLDLEKGEWSHQLLEIWNLSIEDLPKIKTNDEVIGEIKNEALPSLNGIPLAGIIVDQAAALLAENCLNDGEAKCTYGTGAFLLSNIGEEPKISKNKLATSFAWKIHNSTRYYEDGQVFTATSAIDWLIKNGILGSVHEIDSLPIETNGVYCLPGFAGYGAPRWNPNGAASITGLSLSSTRSEIARSVLNGIAAQVTELIEVIAKDGSHIKKMRVDGGLTQSRSMMQFQADLAQIEIEVFPHPDATAVGVGALGEMAIRKPSNIENVLPKVNSKMSFFPKWSADRAKEYMNSWYQSVGGR